MKIAILGGTGDFGRGLALRWARLHNVAIGSRDENRAKKFAEDYKQAAEMHYRDEMEGSITGYENLEAARISEVLVLSVPHEDLIKFARLLKPFVNDKIVISPVVPMYKGDTSFCYSPYLVSKPSNDSPKSYISAAEVVSFELKSKHVVSTFHTLPAKRLCDLTMNPDCDALMAGDDNEAIRLVSKLISQIPDLRPIYAGPLEVSRLLEALTPMLMNLKLYNKIRDPSIKIV
jgi:hypothetical protein